MIAGVPFLFCFAFHNIRFFAFQVAHSGFGSEVGTPMASGCVTPVQLAPVGQAITLVPMGVSASNRLVGWLVLDLGGWMGHFSELWDLEVGGWVG